MRVSYRLRSLMIIVALVAILLGIAAEERRRRAIEARRFRSVVPTLAREHGPFLILAKTFRGPEAKRHARDLALELRAEHGLPTYLFAAKAKRHDYEMVSVLIGDFASRQDAMNGIAQISQLRPRSLESLPAPTAAFKRMNPIPIDNPLLRNQRPGSIAKTRVSGATPGARSAL